MTIVVACIELKFSVPMLLNCEESNGCGEKVVPTAGRETGNKVDATLLKTRLQGLFRSCREITQCEQMSGLR